MKSSEVRRIRAKLEFDRAGFAEVLCLTNDRTLANIENDIRNPS